MKSSEGRVTRSKTYNERQAMEKPNGGCNGFHSMVKQAEQSNDRQLAKRRRVEVNQETSMKIIRNRGHQNRSRQSRMTKPSILCLKPALAKFELVWAHIRGYPNWPGIIEAETSNGKYTIHFFGDYSKSDVTKGKIMHLMEGFNKFTDLTKPTALLLKAINEAKYFVFDTNRSTCPICETLAMNDRSRI